MRSTTLLWQRVMVFCGFSLAGAVGIVMLVARAGPQIIWRDQVVFWIATGVGLVLFGWASSAWLALLARRNAQPGIRKVLRLFSLACVASGLAYLGILNELHDLHLIFNPISGLTLQITVDSMSLVGYCLAGVGFWSAGNVLHVAAEDELQAVASGE